MFDITIYWTDEKIERFKTLMPEKWALIKRGRCPICAKKVYIDDFTEKIQFDEYLISGMCYKCQDEFFNTENYMI